MLRARSTSTHKLRTLVSGRQYYEPIPDLNQGCSICSQRPTMLHNGNYYCFDHWVEFYEWITESERENRDKLTEQGISDE